MYDGVGISLVKVRVENRSLLSLLTGLKGLTGALYGCEKDKKTTWFRNLYSKDGAFTAVNQRNGRSLATINKILLSIPPTGDHVHSLVSSFLFFILVHLLNWLVVGRLLLIIHWIRCRRDYRLKAEDFLITFLLGNPVLGCSAPEALSDIITLYCQKNPLSHSSRT